MDIHVYMYYFNYGICVFSCDVKTTMLEYNIKVPTNSTVLKCISFWRSNLQHTLHEPSISAKTAKCKCQKLSLMICSTACLNCDVDSKMKYVKRVCRVLNYDDAVIASSQSFLFRLGMGLGPSTLLIGCPNCSKTRCFIAHLIHTPDHLY